MDYQRCVYLSLIVYLMTAGCDSSASRLPNVSVRSVPGTPLIATEGDRIEQKFELINSGNIAQNVYLQSSCGCTVLTSAGTAGDGPFELLAHQKKQVEALVNTDGVFGSKRISLYLVSSPESRTPLANATVELMVKGHLRPSQTSVHFDGHSNSSTESFDVFDGLDEPGTRIHGVSTTIDGIQCQVLPPKASHRRIEVNGVMASVRARIEVVKPRNFATDNPQSGMIQIDHSGPKSPLLIAIAVAPRPRPLFTTRPRLVLRPTESSAWTGSVLIQGEQATAADLTVDAPRGLTVEFKGTGGRNQIATISCDAWPESLGEQTEVVFHAPQSGARVAVVVEQSRETVGVQPR